MIQTLGGMALLIPLSSMLGSPAVPSALRLLLGVLWITAIVRPHWALVALAASVPFASWLLVTLDAAPVRLAEGLVLATLSGTLVAAGLRPRRIALRPQAPAITPPVLAFTAIVVASAAVMLQVMQVGTHRPWPFVVSFFVYLTHDYLVGPAGAFVGVADAALLIEGIALALIVARHARDGVTRPMPIFTATALAGAAAAALNAGTLVTSAGAAGSAGGFVKTLIGSRTSAHLSDVNAAGSYFAMAGFVALALALNVRWTRAPRWPSLTRGWWLGVAVLLLAAVWITGSRMAVVAVIATLGVGAMTGPLRSKLNVGALGLKPAGGWTAVVLALAGALVVAALAIGLDPRPSAARSASHMLAMRADFMVTGLRMMASAPIFGVGIGRYFEMSGQFMPSSIYWFYYHENAHNNFLQVGGEVGLVGLAAFVWLLVCATVRSIRGLRADPGDRLLAGAFAGLAAFVSTWMTSHPLLVAEVAYPFWILLGASLARADGDAAVDPMQARAEPTPLKGRPRSAPSTVVAIVILALAVSIPLRARRAVAQLDLSKQSFGFYDWEGDPPQRFRWASRRATFFIPLSSRELRVPLRAIHLGRNSAPTEVSIAIGGRTFHKVMLPDDAWVAIRLRLPLTPNAEPFQRIDIITDPTWSPAEQMGGRDPRVLGVQVGEVRWEP